MSYSDLLANQDKELERLHQEYYTDQVTIKKLQKDHYDKTRFDGQLDRLKASFENKVKDVQFRFKQEQRDYIGEPTPPAPSPDISESQDKAVNMIKSYRQQSTNNQKSGKRESMGDETSEQTNSTKSQPVNEAEVKKLAQQTREKREQKHQYNRRGFRK